MKHKRLLGENKCIILDDNRSEWVMLIDYRENCVILSKSSDSMKTDGEILQNVKILEQGMSCRIIL